MPLIALVVVGAASVGLRRLALQEGRKLWRGLAVLRSLNGGRRVVGFVLIAVFCQIARNWLLLHAVGVDASVLDATAVLIALVTLGQLPVGPAVGAAAAVLILGSDGVALAAAAGVLTTVTGTLGGLCFLAWAGADYLRAAFKTRRRTALSTIVMRRIFHHDASVRIGSVIAVVVAAAALVALLVYGVASQGADTSIDDAVKRGDRPSAPEESLPVLGGGSSGSLRDYRGQVVVLNFWASWCPPCVDELPLLERTQRRIESRGATVVGVNYQDLPEDAPGSSTVSASASPTSATATGSTPRSTPSSASRRPS